MSAALARLTTAAGRAFIIPWYVPGIIWRSVVGPLLAGTVIENSVPTTIAPWKEIGNFGTAFSTFTIPASVPPTNMFAGPRIVQPTGQNIRTNGRSSNRGDQRFLAAITSLVPDPGQWPIAMIWTDKLLPILFQNSSTWAKSSSLCNSSFVSWIDIVKGGLYLVVSAIKGGWAPIDVLQSATFVIAKAW